MAWSDWFLPSTAQTADEADANYRHQQAQYAEALARRRAEQTLTDEQDAAAAQYMATWGLEDQNAAAAQGFREGLAEGAGNVAGAIRGTLSGTINGIFSAIPWQVWILGAVVLFFYAGGAIWLKGRLAK